MESLDSVQEQVVTENRDFIVKHLDAEDVIDALIQERIMGRGAAQRVHLECMSRGDKNRIICEQLTTAGPGAVKRFCKILRNEKRQIFIAERLEISEHEAISVSKLYPAMFALQVFVQLQHSIQMLYLPLVQ